MVKKINKNPFLFQGNAIDSVLLTFVKIVTTFLGLATTKILSTQFSLHEYGTYSQGMLLISTVTSITILGLTDATNFFYNSTYSEETKQQYISTIFGIQYFIGTLAGVLICVFNIPIIKYFNNPDLKKIIYLIAWIPVFDNLIPMLQVLFVSIGRAKTIAVRNFIVSSARLFIITISCYITKDIRTIFFLILVLDIFQTVYFYFTFSQNAFPIRIRLFDYKLVYPILKIGLPMAIFIFTNALSRDIDKYVISFFSDSETLAIYTNAAKILPFDIFTASFFTILIPIITRQVRSELYTESLRSLKAYLRIGYLINWILIVGAILNAKDLMLILYDEKYLSGLNIFIIYLFVDLTKFANVSLILSAKGKTVYLMVVSTLSLILNLVLNIVVYPIMGIVGPAFVTLFISAGLIIVMLNKSAKEIRSTIFSLFNWTEVLMIIVQICSVGLLSYFAQKFVLYKIESTFIHFCLSYCLFVIPLLLLNKSRIIDCFRTINRLK